MNGEYKVEEESSFETPAGTSNLVHLTKERPKSQRRSFREGRKTTSKKSRSNSTGEITPAPVSKPTPAKREKSTEGKKSPPPLSPKPKRRPDKPPVRGNNQFQLPPVSPKPLPRNREKTHSENAPIVSPKPARRKPVVKENESSEEKSDLNTRKNGKGKVNWKSNSFRKNLSKFGESVASVKNSVTASSPRSKKPSKSPGEKKSLIDPDEQTDKTVKEKESKKDCSIKSPAEENQDCQKQKTTESKVVAKATITSKSNERKVSKEQSQEKRKISSTKLTLKSPFKRGKETSVVGTEYTKLASSPRPDKRELNTEGDANEDCIQQEKVESEINNNRVPTTIEKEHMKEAEQMLRSDVIINSNCAENQTSNTMGKTQNAADSNPFGQKSKTLNYVEQELNERNQISDDRSSLNSRNQSITLPNESQTSVEHVKNNQPRDNHVPSHWERFDDSTFKSSTAPIRHDDSANFKSYDDDAYTTPHIKKSYSITTYTPKPVKRRVNENGRIMGKKERAQDNIFRSLSVSQKYENKCIEQRYKSEDDQNNRRHTFSEPPKKNNSLRSRGSYKKKEDQVKLITSSLDEDGSDEDTQLNNRLNNKSSEGYRAINACEGNNNAFDRSRLRRSLGFSKKLSFDK